MVINAYCISNGGIDDCKIEVININLFKYNSF